MSAGFIETPVFPVEIGYWAQGGRGFKTVVVETYGGNEYRNADWQRARGAWTMQSAMRSQNPNSSYYVAALIKFYQACYGRLYGFRFRDPRDYTDAAAGVLGVTGLAVASTTAYQMYKNYSVSPNLYQEKIQKPTVGGTSIYKNGVLQLLTTDYTIDESIGVVTFTSQPTIGQAIVWKGTYEVPARFDFDDPQLGPDDVGALLAWQDCKVVELKNWN